MKFVTEFVNEFVHYGELCDIDTKECELLYKEKKHLFDEQLNQSIDRENAEKFCKHLAVSILKAHVWEKRDGYLWQIKISCIRPD